MDEEERREGLSASLPRMPQQFLFFGSYDHSIDAKGRIIIPNAYRKALGDSFTITVGMDDTSISIYPDAAFMTMVQDLYSMNRRYPNVQRQQDHVAKFSYPNLQADSQGRVLLPVKLRQYVLGDNKDVEISGALDHVRIVASHVAAEEDAYYKAHNLEIRESNAALND